MVDPELTAILKGSKDISQEETQKTFPLEMADTKPRFGGSKVRSGCITCKARHVKCDEAKPHCNRCIRGGRTCEGYATPPIRRGSDQLTIINYVAPNSRSVSPYPQADPREIRALQYFKARAAPELAGSFSPELWNRFMLRMAYHQSSVHHALVALGTVHEEFTCSGLSNFSEYANREYGRAIREVVELAGGTDAVEIVLTTCVLFACLENLRGHYRSSLSHLMSGLNVLEEDQRKARPQQAMCIPRELLLSLLLRMDSQRMDLGGAGTLPGTMLSMIARPAIPSCFTSLDEAQQQLDILYYRILQFLYRAEEASLEKENPYPPEFWKGLHDQNRALEAMRQRWEDSFNIMLGRASGTESQASRNREPGVIVLDMANDTLKIILHVDIVEPELDYDKYDHLFHNIVCNADEYIQSISEARPTIKQSPTSSMRSSAEPPSASATRRPPSQSPPPKPLLSKPEPTPVPLFTLSLGCVNFLYFGAARCRNPQIRHRALDLLRKCNRREGLWDSNIAAQIAGRVIAIEEEQTMEMLNGIRRSLGTNALHTPKGSGVVIPVENRVKMVDLKFGPEGGGKAMYSFEAPTRSTATSGEVPSVMNTTGMGQLFEW